MVPLLQEASVEMAVHDGGREHQTGLGAMQRTWSSLQKSWVVVGLGNQQHQLLLRLGRAVLNCAKGDKS
jgi:hypothetical protein